MHAVNIFRVFLMSLAYKYIYICLVFLLVSVYCDTAQALVFQLLVLVCCDTAQAVVYTKHTHNIYQSIYPRHIIYTHYTMMYTYTCNLWSHTHILQIAIIHNHIVCEDAGSSPTMHNVKLQCIYI